MGEALPVLRDVLQHNLVEEHGDWVQVGRERICPNPKRLQRDRATTGEWIDDERTRSRLAAKRLVRCLHECAGGFQIVLIRRVVPIRKVSDEIEQRCAQVVWIVQECRILLDCREAAE